MKKENILVIAIICIAVIGVIVYNNQTRSAGSDETPAKAIAGSAGASKIDWLSYDQGLELAKKENKHVFLYFHAQWCTYCKKLKKTTLRDRAVINYLKNHFISIKVDTDKNQKLASQWKVRGLPTLWFLKPDHTKISNIPGYVETKQFLTILKYIHTESYEEMSFRDFIKTI